MPVLSKLGSMVPADFVPGAVGCALFAAVMKMYKTGGYERKLETSLHLQKQRSKIHIDSAFFRRLLSIIRVLIPSFFCKEIFYMVLIALSLTCRTYADVWMITTSTRIEACIIDRNESEFVSSVIRYILCMPSISAVNAMLKLSLSELKLAFRERLTHFLYDKYLKGFVFYKMSNIDNRIANADQLLTQDVDKFCESLVELYANISKPLLDLGLYAWRLGSALGFRAPSGLFSYLLLAGVMLTYFRSPVSRLTAKEQQLEGDFRFVNSRIITNSEEIAFYKGEERERLTILKSFSSLVRHLRQVILFRFKLGFVDNIIAKYVATVVGWFTISRPFFAGSSKSGKSKNELMQDYYNSGRMMFKMAEALGRLALAGREATRLAGFTTRVHSLLQVLTDVERGEYSRSVIAESSEKKEVALELLNSTGIIINDDNVIRFENVPLLTPNGDVLIRSLDFEVPSGRNVLVCGPNGCGKSSLFRVLGELWPLYGGTLTKPVSGRLFYVPQRPYMPLGTLRDQVTYPDSMYEAMCKGWNDDGLRDLLGHVQLEYVLEREGGWESVQDWMDVLSGGEKQRIAMARLFYHRPRYAILDECTSAVSVDVEGAMYSLCRSLGITLFTVSHRKSLWVHHEYVLYMDGRGNYEYKPIDDKDVFGS